MQQLLRSLGVEAEVAAVVPLVETLKVPNRNFDEMRIVTHRLPAHSSKLRVAVAGPGPFRSYYEVYYVVRGYPFGSSEQRGNPAVGFLLTLPGVLLWAVLGTSLLAAVLGLLRGELGMLFWAEVAIALATLYVLWSRGYAEKDWKARSVLIRGGTEGGGSTDLRWKGGAIANALNEESQLSSIIPKGGNLRITITPRGRQGLVEIQSGLFESMQEAVPSKEALDAYDTIARRLRGIGQVID
jgi:hypothetical protein